MVVVVMVVEGIEEVEEDGLDKTGDIDIDHHQGSLDIIHGPGLVADVKMDVPVSEVVDGAVSIPGRGQMIAGLRMIVTDADIKFS